MLNFAVGPVMMDQNILKIGSEQILYFRADEFSMLMLENELLIKKFLKAAVMNLLDKNSRVLYGKN